MANPLNEPTGDDKLWSGLGYVGLVCCLVPTIVIFLLKKGESDYIKFHNLQALGFGLVCILLAAVFGVLGQTPGLGFLFSLAWLLINLALLGCWAYLIIVAFMGKDVRIPVLADWIDQNLMQ